MSTVTPQDVVMESRTWEGVPFRHQGRSRTGIDCIGLPICICRNLGVLPGSFVDDARYRRTPDSCDLLEIIQRHCVQLDAVENGCLVLIRWFRAKYPSHTVMIDGGFMIHAYERKSRVVRNTYGEPWVRLVHSIYRLPGVTP